MIKDCKSCRQAKAQANPVPKISNYPVKKVRQQIHCDAVMVSTPMIGKRNGYSMIMDKFTKEVDIKIITRKNEMIQHLQEYMTRLEKMGFKIETIQTDLAGEFTTGKKFISWLQEKGISHEMLAPYLQYQNGIVERHIQTIEDHVTVILIA